MSELKQIASLIRELIKLHTYITKDGLIEIREYRRTGDGFHIEGTVYEPMLQRKRRFKISLEMKLIR